MIKSPILNPKPVKGWVSRDFQLGTASYDLNAIYSPDTSLNQLVVVDCACPKFEPNNKYWFDKSRYGNHGTITGAVWRQLPSGLRYLDFDGSDDKVDLGDIAIVNGASELALELWVKIDSVQANAGVFSKKAQTGAPVAEVFSLQDGTFAASAQKLMFQFRQDGEAGAQNDCIEATTHTLGVWNHYAAIFSLSGNFARIIRNGVQVANVALGAVTALETNDATVKIGSTWIATDGIDGGIAMPTLWVGGFPTTAKFLEHYNQERQLFGR